MIIEPCQASLSDSSKSTSDILGAVHSRYDAGTSVYSICYKFNAVVCPFEGINLIARFEQAKANKKGSDDYKEVAVAAVEGCIDTILVEADRIIAVRITNLVTGNKQKFNSELIKFTEK